LSWFLKRFFGKGSASSSAGKGRKTIRLDVPPILAFPDRPPPTVHDHFDLATWITRFPQVIRRYIDLYSADGKAITSPCHIAIVEQLRAEVFADHPDLEKVPSDVFIWGLGEPVKREVTKVAGIPYWPANRPWPVSTEGRPMDFVAQINFSDSRDLVGDTPGDILLMFSDGECYNHWMPDDEGAVVFHWVNSSDAPLIEPDKVPERRWDIIPCYGVIHRTFDFVDVLKASELIENGFYSPHRLAVIEGTKIGGVPHWIQDEAKLPGRYLCTLGSVAPDDPRAGGKKVPAPFVNREKAFGIRDIPPPYDFLTWGDVGSVYIFMDESGKIHWEEQCT